LWVADLTRFLTGEGVLWLASVRDAFSNRVVGWQSGPRADTDLVLAALEYAIWSRDVRAGQLVHHSDKGCQYTALRFTQRLANAGIAPSTGSVGDSFDNALAESLWSTIKLELVYWPGASFATRAEAETALFRYIDGWYNPRRIQEGLGGLSPDEYEETYHRQQRDQPNPATLQPADPVDPADPR
jgi:putative transposase